MNQFELFCLIFFYLDTQWEETKDEGLGDYLGDMNPFLFKDIGSADPAVYSDFCKIITEPITVENSLALAKKYIASLNDETVAAAFATLDPQEWLECTEEYLQMDHKGKDVQ